MFFCPSRSDYAKWLRMSFYVISNPSGYLVVRECPRVVANNKYATKYDLDQLLARLLHDRFLNFPICNRPNKADLICDRFENIQHVSIALDETKLGIDEPLLLGELFHEYAGFTQVVTRKTREKVMGDLKVKAAVDEGKHRND